MNHKVLIVGGGSSPTGRSLWLHRHLMLLGIAVQYRQLDAEITGKQVHEILVDEHVGNFSDLENRVAHKMLSFGDSRTGLYDRKCTDGLHWMLPEKEPAPDKRKGPKGPRTKWGNLK